MCLQSPGPRTQHSWCYPWTWRGSGRAGTFEPFLLAPFLSSILSERQGHVGRLCPLRKRNAGHRPANVQDAVGRTQAGPPPLFTQWALHHALLLTLLAVSWKQGNYQGSRVLLPAWLGHYPSALLEDGEGEAAWPHVQDHTQLCADDALQKRAPGDLSKLPAPHVGLGRISTHHKRSLVSGTSTSNENTKTRWLWRQTLLQ